MFLITEKKNLNIKEFLIPTKKYWYLDFYIIMEKRKIIVEMLNSCRKIEQLHHPLGFKIVIFYFEEK